MNKIKLVNNVITEEKIDHTIKLTNESFNDLIDIPHLTFEINEDTSLELDTVNDKENKLSITFLVKENVTFKLYEIKEGKKSKTQVKFYLEKNSEVSITKFYHLDGCRELNVVYLEGEGSRFDYNFKTISNNDEKYDMMIYHNSPKTISKIKNSGVNLNESLIFNVSSFVPNGNKKCVVDQSGKIINLTNDKCQINPNLLIDENDVTANHGANICKFNDDEMFYLKSRGLNEKQALNLLIRGFLLDKINVNKEKIEKIIDSYWR